MTMIRNGLNLPIVLTLCFFLSSHTSFSQADDWLPVPYGQTSYFKDDVSGEILPMKTDLMNIGATANFYSIYGAFLIEEFDTCAYNFWNINGPDDPNADFQYVIRRPSEVQMMGRQALFSLPLTNEVGSWHFFGSGHIVKFNSKSQGLVLGELDSIRSYSIFKNDSSFVGEFNLSKHHGLTTFIPIKTVEGTAIVSMRVWNLLGFSDSAQAVGFSLPEKKDYLPYTSGDRILLEWNGYKPDPDTIAIQPTKEFHEVVISSVDTNANSVALYGVMNAYSEIGIFLRTKNDYVLDLDPYFTEVINHPYSVPHKADVLSYPNWFEVSPFGIRMNTGGVIESACNPEEGEGLRFNYSFSSEVGFIHSAFGGSQTPESLDLVAAEGQDFSFGSWPTWLSTNQHTTKQTVSVYPNPTKENIAIRWGDQKVVMIKVYNTLGEVVQTKAVTGEQSIGVELPASPGIYFIEVIDDAANRTKVRVVKS